MKHLLTSLAAAVLAAAAFAAQPAAADELRVGVEGAYPPFSWKEADGSLKGFDIDIALAICEKMGRECVLVEQDWDGMIPALLARKYDAIIASMSITEERKKRVDFTGKYYNTPAMFVAPEGSDLEVSAAGLAGKAIGVQRGTTHQCFMEKIYPDADLRLYATQEEVFSRPCRWKARRPVFRFPAGGPGIPDDGPRCGPCIPRRSPVRPRVPR